MIWPYESVSRTGSIRRDAAEIAIRTAGCKRRPAKSCLRLSFQITTRATREVAIEAPYASGHGRSETGAITTPPKIGYVNGIEM